MIPHWVYFLILIQLAIVSYFDLKTKKIKNYWFLFNLLFFIILMVAYPTSYPFHYTSFIYAFSFLGVGFILYALNIMGAGDTKYLFSFFLITPLALHGVIFEKLLIFTFVSGVVFLIFNLIKNMKKIYNYVRAHYYSGLRECFGTKFSYAPVILLSWIWMGLERGLLF